MHLHDITQLRSKPARSQYNFDLGQGDDTLWGELASDYPHQLDPVQSHGHPQFMLQNTFIALKQDSTIYLLLLKYCLVLVKPHCTKKIKNLKNEKELTIYFFLCIAKQYLCPCNYKILSYHHPISVNIDLQLAVRILLCMMDNIQLAYVATARIFQNKLPTMVCTPRCQHYCSTK